MRRVFCCALVGVLATPISAAAQQGILIPWRPGWVKQFNDQQASGELEAKLFRPAGTGQAPFVVFLHGCNGLKLQNVSHWATFFNRHGVGVLMVDSLATRSMNSTCGDPPPGWVRRRADDATSAQAWLAAQPYVKADRIALMGQSQGGSVTLLALKTEASSANGFVAGIAMYPGCQGPLNAKLQLAKPALVMIGSDDNWTPASDCVALQGAQEDQSRLEVIVYPGAVHSFDNPVKAGLALGKYKIGENPAARDKARARVAQWIDMALKR
jgi:dienelactone hydrolase